MKTITLSIRVDRLLMLSTIVVMGIGVLSFTSKDSIIEDSTSEITVGQANSYYNNNKASLSPFGGSTEAFSVSSQMFDAMKTLNRKVNASGFRMYYAKNDVGQNVALLVGMNMQGQDIVSNIQMTSDVSFFSSCPTICDMSSAIVSEN